MKPTRIFRESPATPYGCRWCGVEKRLHASRYREGHGMHTWVQPTEAQILARMKARAA